MAGDAARMAARERIILEFHPVGAYVKVSAIDPHSLVEVSIVGDPRAGEEALERAALRKLEYVLTRRAARPGGPAA